MLTVLSLCDRTANMLKPWHDAGHACIAVDLNPMKVDDGIHRMQSDVRLLTAVPCDFVFAFPPCTHTAVSGARWFKAKGPRAAAEAFSILAACIDICEKARVGWMIENPVSTFSTYWRKPELHVSSLAVRRQLHQEDLSLDWRQLHHARANSGGAAG